ncbi:hypothetical protein PVK06_042467 [Gossypium arboreum]|uniref:Uncharacterized protein n=1 Tax=Gossypium arboreum TaxID=29729 RepID=A0ABR0ML89_GOSAR|nr:hypothetical protein PVK06_042467 [Gossypium arboreum]
MDYPISFSQVKLASTTRMWLEFISTRIFPATDMSNIDTFQMTLLYAISTKERICVGTWIYWSTLQCARENEVELLFCT